MKKLIIKTKTSILIALSIVTLLGTSFSGMKANAVVAKPSIAFASLGHTPLVVGEKETFMITTLNAEKVQYRMLLVNNTTKKSEELSKGYLAAVDASFPFEFKPSKIFAKGSYTLKVYAKRTTDGVIATKDIAFTCATRDNRYHIYTGGDLILNQTTYKLGDTVTMSGIKGIGGIKGPYKYRLHIYDVNKKVWLINVTGYQDKISWKPTVSGTYILDIHVNTPNSPTWKTYLKNPTSKVLTGTYVGVKMKTIVITEELGVIDIN